MEFVGSGDGDNPSSSAENFKLLNNQWIAFCNFHLGDYVKALHDYKALQKSDSFSSINTSDVDINVAVCMFYLGKFINDHVCLYFVN